MNSRGNLSPLLQKRVCEQSLHACCHSKLKIPAREELFMMEEDRHMHISTFEALCKKQQ